MIGDDSLRNLTSIRCYHDQEMLIYKVEPIIVSSHRTSSHTTSTKFTYIKGLEGCLEHSRGYKYQLSLLAL